MKRFFNKTSICLLAGLTICMTQPFFVGAEETAVQTEENSTQTGEMAIPEERLLPRFVDRADLVAEGQEETLLEKLDEISERQKLDVVIATVDSLEGKTPMDYADDFYDYNGYGFGEDADGILLLISMEDRDWRISTCGFGITAFTDAGQEYLMDQVLPSLSNGAYDTAFYKFADWCDKYITQARTGKPYDTGSMPKEDTYDFSGMDVFIFFCFGFIIACVRAKKIQKRLMPVALNYTAFSYIGDVDLFVEQDKFINSTTTTRIIEQKTHSSGGGSTTHTSSSGRTHGGSGGKF